MQIKQIIVHIFHVFREAAKKKLLLPLLFPLSLMAVGTYSPYFLQNIATNLLKDYNSANISSIDILICRPK